MRKANGPSMTIVRRFIVPPGRTPVVPRQAVLPRDRLHPEAPAGRHTSVRRHRESLLSEILAGKTGVATLVAHSACFNATAPTAAAASQSTQLMRASPM